MSPEALKDISQSQGPGDHHKPIMKVWFMKYTMFVICMKWPENYRIVGKKYTSERFAFFDIFVEILRF